ncbi:MAG: hypothetical protein SGPRY_013516 [Prymnesium sp.]
MRASARRLATRAHKERKTRIGAATPALRLELFKLSVPEPWLVSPCGEGSGGARRSEGVGAGPRARLPSLPGGTRVPRCGRGRAEPELGAASLLVVYSGAPKVGDLGQAARAFGVRARTVDVLDGGQEHDVLRESVFDALREDVRRGLYDVVWLAPPCSSFSVLHLRKTTKPSRSREDPEGVAGLSCGRLARVLEHNVLAARAAALAHTAYEAGSAYVTENPVDRGLRGSPFFRVKLRRHASLWLLPVMQRLEWETAPVWVSLAQCAFLGDFQKLTSLMAAGPRAQRIRALAWARCAHTTHVSRARGRAPDGSSEATRAAAYPPVFNAAVVAALFSAKEVPAEELRQACGSEWVEAPSTSTANGDGAWVAVPSAMPAAWPESEYWCGAEASEAARAELRYNISKRRAEAEKEDILAKERMPVPTQPPRLKARPRTLAKMSSELRAAERRAARGDPDELVPGCLPEVYEVVSSIKSIDLGKLVDVPCAIAA